MEGRDLRSIHSFPSTVFFFPGDQMYSRCVEHKDVSETVIRWCHFCPFVPLTFVSQGERMYSFSPLLTARGSAFPSTRLLKRLAGLGLLLLLFLFVVLFLRLRWCCHCLLLCHSHLCRGFSVFVCFVFLFFFCFVISGGTSCGSCAGTCVGCLANTVVQNSPTRTPGWWQRGRYMDVLLTSKNLFSQILWSSTSEWYVDRLLWFFANRWWASVNLRQELELQSY